MLIFTCLKNGVMPDGKGRHGCGNLSSGQRTDGVVSIGPGRTAAKICGTECQLALSGLQGNIIRGAVLLDFIGFQQGGLQGRAGRGHVQVGGLTEHFKSVLRPGSFLPEITVDALLQRGGLADIEQIAVGAPHAINSGFFRQAQANGTFHGIDTRRWFSGGGAIQPDGELA